MPRQNRSTRVVLFLILLAAAALRLAALMRTPPGLAYEEAALAGTALHPPALLTPGPGSAWITYLMAGSLALFGQNLLGIRFVAAACGLLTLAFTYRWAGLVYSRRAGLIAAGAMAVSFWPLYFSRIGLEAVTLPPLVALASWQYARGLARRSTISLGLAGLATGAALLSPPGAWLMVVIFAVVTAYLAAARRETLRATAGGQIALWVSIGVFGLALLIAQGGPIITPQMAALGDSLGKGDSGPLLDALGRSVSMWTALGDGLFHYNVGFWPVFNVGLATLFVIGLFYPAKQDGSESTGRMLATGWLIAGVIAATLIDPERPFTMGIVALPATYVTLALGIDLVGNLAEAGGLRWAARRWGMIAAGIVALAAAEGLWSYFMIGPNDPQAQGDYRTDLLRLANDLRDHPGGGAAAISTNPPENVPPLIFSFLPHGQRPIRWFDASSGVIIPAGEKTAEIDIPEAVQIGPRLDKILGQPSGGVTGIRRYSLPTGDAFLAASLPPTKQGAWIAAQAAFPPDDPGGVRQMISLPVRFGEAIELAGYQTDTTRAAGKPVRVTLFWRVMQDAAPGFDVAMFAHLLAADGSLATQTDTLAAASSEWRAGDILIQTEDIAIDKKFAPGAYHLEIGLYRRGDTQRLQVMVDGKAVGDRLLLEPVMITTQ